MDACTERFSLLLLLTPQPFSVTWMVLMTDTPRGPEDNKPVQYHGEKTGKDLVFRAEYQTLRKLPATGCIAFSIRTYQRYLSDFQELPRKDSEALIYRCAPLWKDAALTYLRHDVLAR